MRRSRARSPSTARARQDPYSALPYRRPQRQAGPGLASPVRPASPVWGISCAMSYAKVNLGDFVLARLWSRARFGRLAASGVAWVAFEVNQT